MRVVRGCGHLVALALAFVLALPLRAQTHDPVVGGRVPCEEGVASGFSCSRVDLLSFLPIGELGGDSVLVGSTHRPVTLNDVWGWTDVETGREYALVGRSDGTSFVDVTDPVNPRFLGWLPSHEIVASGSQAVRARPASPGGEQTAMSVLHDDVKGVSAWRDVKVIGNFAVIVADATPSHGMQIFDLRRLREVVDPPVVFDESAHYGAIGSAHNVVVNEESGFVYVVGATGAAAQTCGGGLHMVDFSEPLRPTFAGCFADPRTGHRGTGYTHDAQCVIYRGPDIRYHGREICIGSNENAISIADVTDKSAPEAVSVATYEDAAYVHQGWLTEDHRYFLQDDELDEVQLSVTNPSVRTRTVIWDLSDLQAPSLLHVFHGTTQAIDHNQYVVGSLVYQANYTAGLRVIDISDIESPREVAFFDTYPQSDGRQFDGAWSNYPFFRSGIVLVTSIREGLFVLDPFGLGSGRPPSRGEITLGVPYPNPMPGDGWIEVRLSETQHLEVNLYDLLGRRVGILHDGALAPGTHRLQIDARWLPSGAYVIRAKTHSASAQRILTLVR